MKSADWGPKLSRVHHDLDVRVDEGTTAGPVARASARPSPPGRSAARTSAIGSDRCCAQTSKPCRCVAGGPFRRTVFVVVIVIVVVVVVVVVVVAGGMGPVATTIGIERTGMGRSAPVGDRSATDGAASRHALRSGLGEQPPPRVPARPTGRSDRQNGPLLDPPASRSDHVCGQSAKTVRPTARARSRGAFSRCRDAQDEAARVGPGQCANPPGAPVRVGLNPDLIGRTAQPARRAPNVGTLPRSRSEPPAGGPVPVLRIRIRIRVPSRSQCAVSPVPRRRPGREARPRPTQQPPDRSERSDPPRRLGPATWIVSRARAARWVPPIPGSTRDPAPPPHHGRAVRRPVTPRRTSVRPFPARARRRTGTAGTRPRSSRTSGSTGAGAQL
jgi:hypothetical protein